jgi:Icc-related predicted phosphoesterase
MKILYTTDLHGNKLYYREIFKKALTHSVDLVINGADLTPKLSPVFETQKSFIHYLKTRYFPLWENTGIHYICCPGNDDLQVYDDLLWKACFKFKNIHFLKRSKLELLGLEFIGFDLVCDYTFQLKDRCRMDNKNFIFPEQKGQGCFSSLENNGSWNQIKDWQSLAKNLPTIEQELKALVRPQNMQQGIYIIHMPPDGTGLSGRHTLTDKKRPSSKAVFDFLKKEQPLLSLHGHIHNSYKLTGIWKTKIGKTWAVQPGQDGKLPVYCIIDTENLNKMKRYQA